MLSKIRRAVNEIRLPTLIWQAGRKLFRSRPCDLIVFYSPSVCFGGLVGRLKAMWGCGAYLILRDIVPQWWVDVGAMRKGLAYCYFRIKELQQYAVADVIGVQSPASIRYFAEQGWTRRYRLEVLYNWTHTSGQMARRVNLRRKLGLEGKVVLFFGGTMGAAQDMPNLVRLAESLRNHPDIHVLLVGDGTEVPKLKAMIRQKRLTNITLHPAVDQETYLGILPEFDVGLISLPRSHTTHNFPSKLLLYMYNAMPVLASLNPDNDLSTFLRTHEAGLTCVTGDDDVFVRKALRLAQDADLRRRMGANGRRLLESTFSATRAAGQILSHWPAAGR